MTYANSFDPKALKAKHFSDIVIPRAGGRPSLTTVMAQTDFSHISCPNTEYHYLIMNAAPH